MTDFSALRSGVLGIQNGLQGLKRDAAEIASRGQMQGDRPADLIEPLVNLTQDKLQVQASAKVIQATDEMIGSLFDDKA